jgi:hypothetical protein
MRFSPSLLTTNSLALHTTVQAQLRFTKGSILPNYVDVTDDDWIGRAYVHIFNSSLLTSTSFIPAISRTTFPHIPAI